MTKRLIITTITGAVLGIFCIIGANARAVETVSISYLFSFWFNRLVMGMFIGLIIIKTTLIKRLIRGLLVGLFISLAFYSATAFSDTIGFLAGGVYGIIIEYVAYKFE